MKMLLTSSNISPMKGQDHDRGWIRLEEEEWLENQVNLFVIKEVEHLFGAVQHKVHLLPSLGARTVLEHEALDDDVVAAVQQEM